VADLQSRADGAQDKHGLRSEPRPCELCGQLVVSVCDSLDMGEAVTCHYEPATEDETAKRIAALDFTSCQKEDVEAQVLEIEEQNSALRQDAEVGRALENVPDLFQLWQEDDLWYVEYLDYGSHKMVEFFGDTLYAALEAAGLMEK
jgi:hypothetical protein